MAQEDREAYIAWLRDEVGWHCNSRRSTTRPFGITDDSVTPGPDGRGLRELRGGGLRKPAQLPR